MNEVTGTLEQQTKWSFKSWTQWFNLALALILFLQLPEIQAMNIIPQGWVAVIAVIGNILLRFKTNTAVTLLPPK